MGTYASIAHIPPTPVISRFVAPWDTSGWYYASQGLCVGKMIYSNTHDKIARLPRQYEGSDYLVVFDSFAEGFDDKQEVDFSLECDAVVYIAMDASAALDAPADFIHTGDTLELEGGSVYFIYARGYLAGSQVHIDGFKGECHHFIVFAQRNEPLKETKTVASFWQTDIQETFSRRDYAWQVEENFRAQKRHQPPTGFDCTGDCVVELAAQYPGCKHLHMGAGASAVRSVQLSGCDLAEVTLQVLSGQITVSYGGISVLLSRGSATLADGTPLGDDLDGRFVIRLVRMAGDKCCHIWINQRERMAVPCMCAQEAELKLRISPDGEANIDRVTIRDHFEQPIIEECFGELPASVSATAGAAIGIAQYAGTGNSFEIGSAGGACSYNIPALQNDCRVEVTVRNRHDTMTLLPELRDNEGRLALRIAMAYNNLYASDGGRWQRIVGGLSNWNYYPHDNWYRITLVVRLSSHTYDLMVDGAVRASGFSLAAPVENIAQVGFSTQSGGLLIGRIRVWDAPTVSHGILPPGSVHDASSSAYGAVGDGVTDCTAAIQAAIDAAAVSGGTVYLSGGTFLTGSLNLASDITFWLDETATLLGIQDHSRYPLRAPSKSLCAVRQLGRALLYGEGLRNVRITGGGMLNANGRYRFKMNDPDVDKEANARPDHIYIACSEDITLSDMRFTNAAFWTLVLLSCRFALLEHLHLDCMNTPNRDGIDPVDCSDMTIRDCAVMAGDDGVCFKSSYVNGCRNIVLEDMIVQSLASGVKFGTDSYMSFENVLIRSIIIKNVNRCGLAFEAVDGATVRNVHCQDVDMTDCGGPIYLTIGCRDRRPADEDCPVRVGAMEDISFANVSYRKAYPYSHSQDVYESLFVGNGQGQKIRRVTLTDCVFQLPGGRESSSSCPSLIGDRYPEYDMHGLSAGFAFTLRFTEDIHFIRCSMHTDRPDQRPAVAVFDSANITGIY